jgi:uncharacterized protein YjbI with pentapeptide repeats
VDDDERAFKERELALREREFEQRESHQRQHTRTVRGAALITAFSVVVSVAALILAVRAQERQSRAQEQQARESSEEFQQSQRIDEYGQIVDGLSSPSVAVQDSSMRRLVAFVQDRDNYATSDAWKEGFRNAVQTLTAFIADESASPDKVGLAPYQNPQPIIVPRAMSHLRLLSSMEMNTQVIDISRADLHGAYLPDYRPTVHIVAAGADFRRANLANLDLTADGAASTLNAAFFTCANLSGAHLGHANLAGADLTGADLRGADLSHVTGLERQQLHGVTTGEHTRLPKELQKEPQIGWRDTSRCYSMVNDMTGMRGGQGYVDTIPCPHSSEAAKAMDLEPTWVGDPVDLVTACQLRGGRDAATPNVAKSDWSLRAMDPSVPTPNTAS